MRHIIQYVLFVIVISGCASQSSTNYPAPPPVIESTPSSTQPKAESPATTSMPTTRTTAPVKSTQPVGSHAITQLLAEAKQSIDNGHYDQAAIRVERALRIAPENGYLWHNLAMVRYYQNRFDQCVELTKKAGDRLQANQLAARQNNWRLMAACYEALGQSDKASWARSKGR